MPIKDAHGVYWIGLTPKDYENLSLNMQVLLQTLKQKNAVIDYQWRCIDNFNKGEVP